MLNFCSIFLSVLLCLSFQRQLVLRCSFNTQAEVQWLRCGEAILEYKFFLKIIVAGELER